jgi:hypothetical protein
MSLRRSSAWSHLHCVNLAAPSNRSAGNLSGGMMLELTRFPVQAEDAYKHEEGRAGWLEVYGETEPTATSGGGTPPAKGVGLYEYVWSLGYLAPLSSHPPHGRSMLRGGRAEDGQQDSDRLADPAAHAYLYFAADSSWRVSEVLATVKHLAPVQDERTWGEELAKDFTAIQPVIGAAGQIAGAATGMPELGSIAATVSRLKLTSVPPTQSSEWFVRKVDMVKNGHMFHGIEWELSLNLLNQLGSRVTGGILVCFVNVETKGDEQAAPSQGLLAKTVLHYIEPSGTTKDISIPVGDDFLGLSLSPSTAGS